VRSAGGDKWGLLGRKKEDREKGDERILGSGAFVEEILKESDEAYEIANRDRISVDELIRKVVANMDLDLADLTSPKRNRKLRNARVVISYLAVNQLACPVKLTLVIEKRISLGGFSASEVARKLGISGMAVGKCVDRGKETLLCREMQSIFHWYDKSEIMREYLS